MHWAERVKQLLQRMFLNLSVLETFSHFLYLRKFLSAKTLQTFHSRTIFVKQTGLKNLYSKNIYSFIEVPLALLKFFLKKV